MQGHRAEEAGKVKPLTCCSLRRAPGGGDGDKEAEGPGTQQAWPGLAWPRRRWREGGSLPGFL